MKNLSLLIILLFWATTPYSQIPNGNFEEWEIVGNIEQPKYWKTNNVQCCSTVVKTGDAIEGNYSMKISSTAPSIEGTLPGWAEITLYPGQVYQNFSASIRIDSIEMGKVIIEVQELSNGSYGQIGYWESNTATSGVLPVTFPINQSQTDSLKITVTAANSPGPLGSEGYAETVIDKLTLSGIVSTEKIKTSGAETLRIAPNPSSHSALVSFGRMTTSDAHLRLIDIHGNLLYQDLVSRRSNTILDTRNLPEGIYVLALTENGRVSLQAGIVIKH